MSILPSSTSTSTCNEPPEAPGAKAARICSILAISFGVTCVGIPAAIVLGIIALVQHAKAKRLAGEFPAEFRKPAPSGFVLGLIGLILPILMMPIAGIVTAIAVPAFMAQRERAASQVMRNNLLNMIGDLATMYGRGIETGQDQPSITASLEQILRSSTDRNPISTDDMAFRQTLAIVEVQSVEEAQQRAEAQANALGETVFVISFPSETHASAYLAGAGRLRRPVNGSAFVSHAMALD